MRNLAEDDLRRVLEDLDSDIHLLRTAEKVYFKYLNQLQTLEMGTTIEKKKD